MPTWNPDQYLKFDEERTRPCRDLALRVSIEQPGKVIDLGCGPGNSTRVLAERWPNAEVVGLDDSAEMIAAAQEALRDVRWMVADIAGWAETEPQSFDVVFSNAALQWVENHAVLFPRLLQRAVPGGALAVQMPANMDAPAHALMRDLASSSRWRALLPGRVRQWHTHDFDFYYDVLSKDASRIDMWFTEYIHVLPDAAAIVEWYKGTGLRPFLEALPSEFDREAFLAEYHEGVGKLYPPQADGRVLLPFRRCFAIACRR